MKQKIWLVTTKFESGEFGCVDNHQVFADYDKAIQCKGSEIADFFTANGEKSGRVETDLPRFFEWIADGEDFSFCVYVEELEVK